MPTQVSKEDLTKRIDKLLDFVKKNNLFGSTGLFHQSDFDLVREAIEKIKSRSEAGTALNRLAVIENRLDWALGKTKTDFSEKERKNSLIEAKKEFNEVASNLFLTQANEYSRLADQTKDRGMKKRYKEFSAKNMDSYWAAKELGLPKEFRKRKAGQLMIESFLPGAESLYATSKKKKAKKRRRRKR